MAIMSGGNAFLTQRRGGRYEAAGFVLILLGSAVAGWYSGGLGGIIIAIGFITFLFGRFM